MYYCSPDFSKYSTIHLDVLRVFYCWPDVTSIGELIYYHESFCPFRRCSQLNTGSLIRKVGDILWAEGGLIAFYFFHFVLFCTPRISDPGANDNVVDYFLLKCIQNTLGMVMVSDNFPAWAEK